jgi:uncharacterized protein DUF6411
MLIAAIVVICVVLLILGFLAPRLSSGPQRGVDRTLSIGGRGGRKLPGPLGRWVGRSFSFSERAADKSASLGRRGRRRLPL